jgi:hypothetical protein
MSDRATRLTGLYAVIAVSAAALLSALLALSYLATNAGAEELASAKAAGGKQLPQRLTIYSANIANREAPALVEATGPISGIGLVTAGAAPGNTVPLTLALPKGKVILSARGDFRWKPDFATCTATRDIRGTYTITGGTGAYRSATGKGRFREQGAAIGVRSSSGTCLKKFKVNYVTIVLTGSASVRSS